MATENTYIEIPHGRIYSSPLNGSNPKGMTAWFDRRVFAEKGYKVTGCFSTNNILCVPLDPNDPHDRSIIRMEEEMIRIIHTYQDEHDDTGDEDEVN